MTHLMHVFYATAMFGVIVNLLFMYLCNLLKQEAYRNHKEVWEAIGRPPVPDRTSYAQLELTTNGREVAYLWSGAYRTLQDREFRNFCDFLRGVLILDLGIFCFLVFLMVWSFVPPGLLAHFH